MDRSAWLRLSFGGLASRLVARPGMSLVSAAPPDGGVFNIKDFGALGNGLTDDTAAIQAAVDAAAKVGDRTNIGDPYGATVVIPASGEAYRITRPIRMKPGVNLLGHGPSASVIQADHSDALALEFSQGFGHVVYSNFGLRGTPGMADVRAGIRAGTASLDDTIYGLTLEKLQIAYFHTAVRLRTVRNLFISDIWAQYVTVGIQLGGAVIVASIQATKLNSVSGNGPGTKIGLLLEPFTYSNGAAIAPEGVHVVGCQFFGFERGVDIVHVNFCNLIAADISSTVYGIRFVAAQVGLTIMGCFIEMTTEGAIAGVFGAGLNSPAAGHSRILNNTIIGANLGNGSCTGVKINEPTNQYQDDVFVEQNYMLGLTGADIVVNNGNGVTVRGNKCDSGSGTSIRILDGVGPKPIDVSGNTCAGAITYDPPRAMNGIVRLGENVLRGNREVGTAGMFRQPAFAAADYAAADQMRWAVERGNVEDVRFVTHGRTMTVSFSIAGTTVAGARSSGLRIRIPDGRKARWKMTNAVARLLDNGALTPGYSQVLPGSEYIEIVRSDGAPFSASTGRTSVSGQITIETE
jgi:hypothetical protein